MAKIMSWEKAAKLCEELFGTFVDWDERFFICPECDEPIYECDFKDHGWYTCPVCETYWEDIE